MRTLQNKMVKKRGQLRIPILDQPLPKAVLVTGTIPSYTPTACQKGWENLQLNDLLLGEKTGRGGFTKSTACGVWKALHRDSSKPLATKIISGSPEAALNEADRAKAPLTDRTVHTYKAFTCSDLNTLAVVMEYMKHGSLEGGVKKLAESGRKMSVADMAFIASKLLHAVCELEAQGRAHNDIKPANILVNGASEVKLGDFGISSSLGDAGVFTEVGSKRWMSPERLDGKRFTSASDVYSVGLVVAYLALGRAPRDPYYAPFNGSADPYCAEELREVNASLASFVELCTAKKQKDRPLVGGMLQHQFLLLAGGSLAFLGES
eukprot:TRINITY_DN5902_c0_g2_i1.p1 TRINITY_DN5902_c0_g2~~TRINITY_DN5902_c0_g2_i1.p1  ORF type:complete len:321 (+),score=90.98 TRINITY_DN5902_c0_g2_i1:185-1147(+)